jgi:ABC-2 type transport system ATP-binding protein
MDKPAIEIRGLTKAYRVYHDRNTMLKERVLFNRTSYSEHVVLRDLDLEIPREMTIGIIGRNGSGKSTLLKLMTGIIYPDQGEITIRGKISSILELGAGFHPEYSGRENIYNSAAVAGLSRSEIVDKYRDIVDFSELEEYIDNPVRTYSSGMYMRLAFSVAISVNAEVLLVDEILSVGDAIFQEKCLDRIREMKARGLTIVIVSHGESTIRDLCDEAIWLRNGCIHERGAPLEVLEKYLADR